MAGPPDRVRCCRRRSPESSRWSRDSAASGWRRIRWSWRRWRRWCRLLTARSPWRSTVRNCGCWCRKGRLRSWNCRERSRFAAHSPRRAPDRAVIRGTRRESIGRQFPDSPGSVPDIAPRIRPESPSGAGRSSPSRGAPEPSANALCPVAAGAGRGCPEP